MAALERNASGRAHLVADEIKFITDRADKCALIVDALESGDLPLRVTHNDTKLSNILLDETTDLHPVADPTGRAYDDVVRRIAGCLVQDNGQFTFRILEE